MTLLGIDPGLHGALVALHVDDAGDASPLAVLPMPIRAGELDHGRLMSWLLEVHPARAVIERAQSMPGQGGAGIFRYGTGYGELRGILSALEVPWETVHPATWHRALCGPRCDGDPKERALKVVEERLPGLRVIPPRCRVPHDGIVDAACLGLWLADKCNRAEVQRG